MTTELKKFGKHPFSLMRYWGGESKGASLQVTGPNCDGLGYVGLSREEASALSIDLMIFASAMEVCEDEEQRQLELPLKLSA